MAANPAREVTRERERRAWELRVTRFLTEEQIAAELEVDQSTVSRMLQRAEKRLASEFVGRAEQIKAEQTAQLLAVAQEAQRAWERSQQDAEVEQTVVRDVTVDGVGKDAQDKPYKVDVPATETTTTKRRTGQVGDYHMLEQMRGALSDVREIWGLNAAKKTDVTSDGHAVKAIIGVDLDKV